MGKTAFIFSGQGAQFPGMMKEHSDTVLAARRVFEMADDILGRSISHLCFEGTQEELNLTHNTQPCVLAADLAAYEAALASGLEPDGVAGFSLGEYAALVAAGCINIEDAFQLVQLRADAMQDAVPVGEGAMAAIMKASAKEVEELCALVNGYVVPANYNSPAQIVVSGENTAVDTLVLACKKRKIRAIKLPVSAPFHCELMEPVSETLRTALDNISISEPSIPIYMNVDALPLVDTTELINKMSAQVTSPVRWQQTLDRMYTDGFTQFVECGPGTTLTGFVKKTLPEAIVVE